MLSSRRLSTGVVSRVRVHATPDDRLASAGATPRSQGTRAAIVAAAREAFIQNGLADTRLAAVARAAWVAPSTVSLHFKGKQALYTACIDEDITSLFAATSRRLAGHPYPYLSGDFARVLGMGIRDRPLLSQIIVDGASQWSHRIYVSGYAAAQEAACVAELGRAREAGLLHEGVAVESVGRSIAHLVIWNLWTAVVQKPSDDCSIERLNLLARSAVLLPVTGAEQVEAACVTWRQARPLA